MNFRQKLLFLAGQFGVMLLVRFFLQWITKFAATAEPTAGPTPGEALFSAALVGTALFAFRIFDGATDPVAGLISDGWVRKGRERRTLLWYAFLIPPIGLALIFMPSFGMGEAVRWTFLLAGMFIFFVGYTFYAIPYWSLCSDYAQGDADQNRVLSSLLGAGIMLATGVGFVLTPFMVESWGYLNSALIIAVPASICMILPYFARPEGELATSASTEPKPLFASLKMAFSHRRFLAVMIIFSGSQMSLTVMTAAAPFIAVELLGGGLGDVALLMGPLLVVSIPSFFLAPKLSRMWGWEMAIVIASVALGIVYATVGVLGDAWLGTPMTTAMVIFGLAGPMVAILLGLEGEAITACADERGGDAVSIYFGVYNFLVKAMNGLAIMLAGILAERVAMTEGDLIGVAAVRGMGFVAAGCLFVGVLLYVFARPRKDARA